jgi:hypothetical protein
VVVPGWSNTLERSTTVVPPTIAVCTPGSDVSSSTEPSACQRHTCWLVASLTGLVVNVTWSLPMCSTARTCWLAMVTGAPSTSRRREPIRSAHMTSRPSASSPGTPGTSSTHWSSWSVKRSMTTPVAASTSMTRSWRWSRDWMLASNRSGLTHRTAAR